MISLLRLLAWSVAAGSVTLAPSTFAPSQGPPVSNQSQDKHNPVVKAPAGAVKGQIEDNLRVFKGIPFALPPVGERRWKAPSPMPPWTGVRKATEYGAACWQPKPTLSTIYTRNPMPQGALVCG